jgi:cobalt-zinc-cadmium efflux system outer membrane protein
LTLPAAVQWALQNNPALAASRQQHGIAAAAVVIARTYPFNPVLNTKNFAAGGPEEAGITNRVSMEQRIDLVLEVRHQRKYRREAAGAALTRTEWEIAFQEQLLAIQVIRAYKSVLYRQGKARQAQATISLNERTAEEVARAVKLDRLRPLDELLARNEVYNSRALVDTARFDELKATQDLRRALGLTEGAVTVQGTLDVPGPIVEAEELVLAALERRPDLHARQAAINEAEARVRLARADRFGNPNLGPDFELNETSVHFIGFQLVMPLPILNTRRGDILQREAELTRAAFDLRNTETIIRQDVQFALERLQNARGRADTYRTQILLQLEASVKDIEVLMNQGGAPALSVIAIQRNLLRAQDSYLDVLNEVNQAQVDLAAAVGDPDLAIGPCGPEAELSSDPPQPSK